MYFDHQWWVIAQDHTSKLFSHLVDNKPSPATCHNLISDLELRPFIKVLLLKETFQYVQFLCHSLFFSPCWWARFECYCYFRECFEKMLIYLIVDHLHDGFLVLVDISSWSRIPPIIKRLNSRSLWPSFRWSAMRKFSEGPVLSIGPFQKVQLEVIYFYIVRKNKKLC